MFNSCGGGIWHVAEFIGLFRGMEGTGPVKFFATSHIVDFVRFFRLVSIEIFNFYSGTGLIAENSTKINQN